MKSAIDDYFDTIESAHDFVSLLSETVSQAKQELEMDVARDSAADLTRRLDALRLALYKIDKLELHLNRSSRILNDLRSLRRLLFDERHETGATVSSQVPSDLRMAESIESTEIVGISVAA
jgi:hypothetical protein